MASGQLYSAFCIKLVKPFFPRPSACAGYNGRGTSATTEPPRALSRQQTPRNRPGQQEQPVEVAGNSLQQHQNWENPKIPSHVQPRPRRTPGFLEGHVLDLMCCYSWTFPPLLTMAIKAFAFFFLYVFSYFNIYNTSLMNRHKVM